MLADAVNLPIASRYREPVDTNKSTATNFTQDPKCKSQKKACASELPLSLTDQRTFSKARRPRA